MEFDYDDDATSATSSSGGGSSPSAGAAAAAADDNDDTGALFHSTGGASPGTDAYGDGGGYATGNDGGDGYSGGAEEEEEQDSELQAVFDLIARYRPTAAPPRPPLKPFIPGLVPALGTVDDFVRVPRPDGRPDGLGLQVLDEPAAFQSDPALLALRLRRPAGDGAPAGQLAVGADMRAPSKAIDAWVAAVAEAHKRRPTTATMTRAAAGGGGGGGLAPSSASCPATAAGPSVDDLMRELPPGVEAALRGVRLPGADLDIDLESYARLVCALLDAPVAAGGSGRGASAGGGAAAAAVAREHRALLEALRGLFLALLAFKANPYFARARGGGGAAVAAIDAMG